MIGKIVIGKSFRGCIQYCLRDKLTEQLISAELMKDRAEILHYNQCFGNETELIKQFNEVKQLNHKLSKPVWHITLSLASGEELPRHKLIAVCEDCAKHLGFEKNQYLAVQHKDTGHQHLHIVVNRVGFDGKTVSDSNSYKKIASFCREMELAHGLQKVLSPKRYLSENLRNKPRLDQRKEQLKLNIRQSLLTSGNYPEFEKRMKQMGYDVIKSRGIAFRDQQKVYTKGSEVGYSLQRIEQLLQLTPSLKVQLLKKQATQSLTKEQLLDQHKLRPQSLQIFNRSEDKISRQEKQVNSPAKEINAALSTAFSKLVQADPAEENMNTQAIQEELKRRRKQKLRL